MVAMVEQEELDCLEIITFPKITLRCIVVLSPLFMKGSERGIQIPVVHIFKGLIVILEQSSRFAIRFKAIRIR